jgi:Uma2 family endonuclease
VKTPVLTRHRFTVDEYYRMAEAGILWEDERIELIDGESIVMSPIGPLHMGCVATLAQWLSQGVGKRALVWVQNAILIGRHGAPEPDIALLRP